MKKKVFGKVFSKTSKKALATVLAAAMAVSGVAYAAGSDADDSAVAPTDSASAVTKEAVTSSTYKLADVNRDGEISLEDAQLTLRGALLLEDLDAEQQWLADVTEEYGVVDLTDAQMVLRRALILVEELPEKPVPTEPGVDVTETPAPQESELAPPVPDFSIPPIESVKPFEKATLPAVEADIANVVTAMPVEVEKYNGAFMENNTLVFGDLPQPASGETVDDVEMKGVQMVNPFAGRDDLVEAVEDVVRTETTDGRKNVWDCTGAALTGDAVGEHSDWDPRIWKGEEVNSQTGERFPTKFAPDEIEYTRPEWNNGVSVSFWVKTESKYNGDPILVFENDQYILSVRLNGTVRFLDNNSKKGENQLELQSTNIDPWGTFGEWTHYTITIANDWIQVYINGQENVYTKPILTRKKISLFNDGFLTRYNPTGDLTEADLVNNPRGYWTVLDDGKAPWYYDSEDNIWRFHDNFGVFHNQRYRGAASGNSLLIDLITHLESRMWIGGAATSIEPNNTARKFSKNTNVADIKAYDVELTAEQVAACYEYDTATPEAVIMWDESKAIYDEEAGGSVSLDGITFVDTTSPNAKIDVSGQTITFGKINPRAAKGVEIANPFSGRKEIKETLKSALEGQEMFPWLAEDSFGWAIQGGTLEYGGCEVMSTQVQKGNFYDVYYGPVNMYGNEMNPPTCIQVSKDGVTVTDKVYSEEEVAAMYPDQQTTYQRPEWHKGASFSFWAKPVEADDSPLVTFKGTNILLVISVRGDVVFYSLDAAEDWKGGAIQGTGLPYNTFSALADGDMVNPGEWNYYTITMANDWIQVYINGEEMVYDLANLNRQYTKQFNHGYLTRYNTVGIWTTDKFEEEGDPTGVTLEGKARNYLGKSGYLWDVNAPVDDKGYGPLDPSKGPNTGNDSASIRMNGVYENPYNRGTTPLIDLLIDSKTRMYFGGISSIVDLKGQYTFQDLRVTTDTSVDLVKYVPEYIEVEVEDASTGAVEIELQKPSTSLCKYFYSDHTIDQGTEVYYLSSYLKELTAQEVKDYYEAALVANPDKAPVVAPSTDSAVDVTTEAVVQ